MLYSKYDYIGFEDNTDNKKYMVINITTGPAAGPPFGVRMSEIHYRLTQDFGDFFIFETNNDLLEWMKD